MGKTVLKTEKKKPAYLVEDRAIFRQLRQEASEITGQLEPGRKGKIIFKAVFFPAVYIFIYAAVLTWGKAGVVLFSGYFLLGLMLVFIFLNVIHDAVHGTIFKNRRLNGMYVHLFDLMGANSYIWKIRHVRFHHNYPNVNGWDTDIEQSKIFRVFPDGDYAPVHKYQHIYLPLLYPFYLANWLLIRDFKDFFNKKKTVRKLICIPAGEYIRLFFFKALFLFYMLILPKVILGISWLTAIAAFAVFLFTASIFSLMVLLTPHANIESEFPKVDEHNKLPHSWMMHMLLTTNDITLDNFFTRFFMGCFNFHVVHHLFPHVNHIYYPEITSRLRSLAVEYHLPYRECSLFHSLRNHYQLLKRNGVKENIFEETM